MTTALTAAMTAANDRDYKRPAYYVTFFGIPYTFSSSAGASASFVPLLFGHGKVFGPQPTGQPDEGYTYKFGESVAAVGINTLKTPSGVGAVVTPDQGVSSVSGVSISLQDSPELRNMFSSFDPIKGRRVSIFAGYDNVVPGEWPQVFAGLVTDATQFEDGLGWTIECSDLQRLERRQVFAVLSATLLIAITDVSVTATTTEDLDTLGWPAAGAFKIDRELIGYSSRTSTVFSGLTRGLYGTKAEAHQSNARIGELFVLTGHPIDILLRVLTSTGAGTNGVYDLLPARHGLGILQADIDVAKYVEIKNDLSSATIYEFRIVEPTDSKTWIEREICKTSNVYQVTRGDGKLSLVLFEPPDPASVLQTLDDNNCIGFPVVNMNYHRHYNQCVWKYDFDPATNSFLSAQIEDNVASQARYGGKISSMVFESRGLRTTGSAQQTAIARSQRFFTRYSEPPIEFQISGLYKTFVIEPGDLVSWSSVFPLNPRSLSRGFAPLTMEVISREMDFEDGVMRFRLLYTPFASARYGKYHQVGAANYAASTQAQRLRFVHIATDTNGDLIGDLPDTADDADALLDPPYRYQ